MQQLRCPFCPRALRACADREAAVPKIHRTDSGACTAGQEFTRLSGSSPEWLPPKSGPHPSAASSLKSRQATVRPAAAEITVAAACAMLRSSGFLLPSIAADSRIRRVSLSVPNEECGRVRLNCGDRIGQRNCEILGREQAAPSADAAEFAGEGPAPAEVGSGEV